MIFEINFGNYFFSHIIQWLALFTREFLKNIKKSLCLLVYLSVQKIKIL